MQVPLQSSVIAQSEMTMPPKPMRLRRRSIEQLVAEPGAHQLQRPAIERHAMRHYVGRHDAGRMCREHSAEGIHMRREARIRQPCVATVVVVAVETLGLRAVTHPVLRDRRDAVAPQAAAASNPST